MEYSCVPFPSKRICIKEKQLFDDVWDTPDLFVFCPLK